MVYGNWNKGFHVGKVELKINADFSKKDLRLVSGVKNPN